MSKAKIKIFDKKRIMVTGGAGFLGSHLCDFLLEKGHSVICVDNFHSGRRENIQHLLHDDEFTLIEHDIQQPLHVRVDEIYNLACPASPVHYQRDPIDTIRTNVMGAINLLDMARDIGAKIFQASTSEVYGDPEVHPQKEEYWGNVNPIGPRACYDEGKRCAETLFYDYQRYYDMNIRVARIFNTYGPRMRGDDGRVVSNFILQALKNEPITIYGDGSQTRSFCYVSDLIEGFWRLMNAADECSDPVNLGNPGEFTMLELAEKVKEFTGSKSEIIFKPLPQDDPRRRRPDISRAKEKLGWEPGVPLENGLKNTIEFYRQII